MALVVNSMKRRFSFKHANETLTLNDPDPTQSPDAVMSFYANTYPELTTATVHGPVIVDDVAVYAFKTTIGIKG